MLFGKLRKILLIIVVIALIAFSIKGEKIFPKKVILPNSFFSFHNFRASSEPDGYINIYGSHTVGQEAVMNFPSLCRLGFLIRKDKITDKNLILHVRRSIQDKKDMLVLRAKKSDLFDNYYPFLLPEIITGPRTSVFYFQFKPLTYPDKNKIYFWLESPDSTAEDGIKIAYYKNKYWRGYVGGPSYLDGAVWDKYLAFHTYHCWNGDFSGIFKDIKDKIIKDIGFFVFYLALCLSIIIAIFIVGFQEKHLR